MGGMPKSNTINAWKALREGNERFVAGESLHPSQSIERRAELAGGQKPTAVLFGCADSRVAAEIIFDQGLGDLFVVRTAGHTVDSSVLGSMEFGVGVLGIPLIVILGHDSCGAVNAAVDAMTSGDLPGGFVRDIVERVMPSVLAASKHGEVGIDQIEAEHVRQTAALVAQRSHLIADHIAAGSLGIIGATYNLRDGQAGVVTAIGIDVT